MGLQTKLRINAPGDTYEREADRIADRVMAIPAGPTVHGAPPRIQHVSDLANGQTDAAPASVDRALASPGRPLDPAFRRDMEQRFGHDFSRVRVHSGAAAEQSARDVNADAYTVGHNIVFAEGQFAPQTTAGRRLLAHELTHVVQQSGLQLGARRQEPKDTGEAAPTSRVSPPQVVQRSPDEETSCAIHETLLVYQGTAGKPRCITEDDPEFRQNYIDNNIVQAPGLAIPDTTWANIDHDRVPQIMLTYKDGRTLIVEVKDIQLPATKSGPRGPTTSSILRLLARYEKRSDGFIYPIRSGVRGKDYVSYEDASNIVSLRAGLHDRVEELKKLFLLVELGAGFAQNIAALGGFAAMGKGKLFEPIPRKGKTAGQDQPETQKAPVPQPEEGAGKPPPKPRSATGDKTTLAEGPGAGGQKVRIKKGGIVEVCSDCANISLVFREALDQNPDLAKTFRDIRTRAQQAEKMIESGDPKLKARGEKLAKEAHADAVRLQTRLVTTGIRRGGTRYRPEPDLLGSGRHGLEWKDSNATKRAQDTGNPQGKFGSVQDVQYAVDRAADLGPGNQGFFPLPADNRSRIFMPDGSVQPATRIFVLVRRDGSVHAYPL
ncbi:hypothetical protein BH23GEM7_BH23GEM7_23990 [soil metagenome]